MTKILVLENEEQARNMFLKCLESQGFDASGAENSLVGVQQAREHLPDLIISEIIMPELDGYGVLRALRQNPTTAIIPLIFVTAKVTLADIRKGIELGADDYLTKPCTVEQLLRAIRACLEKRALLQKWYAAQFHSVPEPALAGDVKSTAPQSIFPSDPELREVFRFIEANYHLPITLSDVAVAVAYCSTYLTDLVRRQTGQTVQSWIISRRMAAARSLLLETDEKVEEIAGKVGYQNQVHFFRQFRQHHRTTPQTWRKAHRSQREPQQKRRIC